MGAPRMTRADKWKQRDVVLRYHSYRDSVREFCERYGYEQGETLDIVFTIPMPPSWSAKKREKFLGKPHQQKFDIDNLIKAWLDALLTEDSHVWSIKAQKIWGEEGNIAVAPL